MWHKCFCHINVFSFKVKVKVIKLKTDRGGEFRSNAFKQCLIDTRIEYQLTAPSAPEYNAFIEGSNWTAVEAM